MRPTTEFHWKLLVWGLFSLLFLVVAWRCFWISDDAAITFRSVLNLLDGHGARFNLEERVQSYTHPAWAALLALLGHFGMSVAGASLVLSLVLGLGIVALLAFAPPGGIRAWQAAALLALLFSSRTFIDYSSSGLENPLSAFLLIAAATCINRSFLAFCALCGLALLSRIDLLFALAAPVAFAAWRHRSRTGGHGRPDRSLVSGFALLLVPSLLLVAASLAYYGHPVPNTAVAKLTTSISTAERIGYGLAYWFDSFRHYDPVPLSLLVLATVVAVACRSLEAAAWAVGGMTHLAYVVWTGGDFMAGRFTETALLCAACSLAFAMGGVNRSTPRSPGPGRLRRLIAASGVAIGASGMVAAVPAVYAGAALRAPDFFGRGQLADERGHLENNHWTEALPVFVVMERSHWGRQPQRVAAPVLVCGGLGLHGMLLGPGVPVLDLCGLADAFIARQPPARSPHWRAGHEMRNLPDGYYESVVTGRNLIGDPRLRMLFDQINLATRADLDAPGRGAAIVSLLAWKAEASNRPFQEAPREFRVYSRREIDRWAATMRMVVARTFPNPDEAISVSLLYGAPRRAI